MNNKSIESIRLMLEQTISHLGLLSDMDIHKEILGMINEMLNSFYIENNDKPKFEKAKGYELIDFKLPVRGTKGSAGYDFELIEDLTLEPKQTKLVPTGVKAYMPEDMVLLIFIRSSLGIKKGLRQILGVSVIDSDYYNNVKNDGAMFIPIINDSELTVTLHKGDRIAQGVFVKYATVEDYVTAIRTGGIGSTNGI